MKSYFLVSLFLLTSSYGASAFIQPHAASLSMRHMTKNFVSRNITANVGAQREDAYEGNFLQSFTDKIFNWCVGIAFPGPQSKKDVAEANNKKWMASSDSITSSIDSLDGIIPEEVVMQSMLIAEEAERVAAETEIAMAELNAARRAAAEIREAAEREFAEFQRRQAERERQAAEEWAAAEKKIAQEMAAFHAACALNRDEKMREDSLEQKLASELAIAQQKSAAEMAIAAQREAAEQSIASQIAAAEQLIFAQSVAAEKAAADKILAEQAAAEALAILQEAMAEKAEVERIAAMARQTAEQFMAEQEAAERAAAEARAAAEKALQEKEEAEIAAARAKQLALEALDEVQKAQELIIAETNAAVPPQGPAGVQAPKLSRRLQVEKQNLPVYGMLSLEDRTGGVLESSQSSQPRQAAWQATPPQPQQPIKTFSVEPPDDKMNGMDDRFDVNFQKIRRRI